MAIVSFISFSSRTKDNKTKKFKTHRKKIPLFLFTMFKVKDADEANRVAREMCRRHPELLSQVGPTASARDVALKIFLSELQVKNGVSSDYGSPSPNNNTTTSSNSSSRHHHDPHNISHDHHLDASPIREPTSTTSMIGGGGPGGAATTEGQVGVGGGSNGVEGVDNCIYCNEPSSRYCKETGRRHETTEQRCRRYWKRIYRQLSMASHFVNTARLGKKNTCTEDYGVELNFD